MRTILKSIEDVIIGEEILQPTEFPDISYKFASYNFVMNNSSDYIRYIISKMPIIGDRKNILVDIKVHHLKKGDYPALKHSHIDVAPNPHYKGREEHHHLFVSGFGCRTEFLKNRVEVNIPNDKPINFDKILPKNTKFQKIYGGRIYSYGRVLHKASKSEEDFTRLLVRVTETDNIHPNNKLFKPTQIR